MYDVDRESEMGDASLAAGCGKGFLHIGIPLPGVRIDKDVLRIASPFPQFEESHPHDRFHRDGAIFVCLCFLKCDGIEVEIHIGPAKF